MMIKKYITSVEIMQVNLFSSEKSKKEKKILQNEQKYDMIIGEVNENE